MATPVTIERNYSGPGYTAVLVVRVDGNGAITSRIQADVLDEDGELTFAQARNLAQAIRNAIQEKDDVERFASALHSGTVP